MSRYYLKVSGKTSYRSQTVTRRCYGGAPGVKTGFVTAASFSGAVTCEPYTDEANRDCVRITRHSWQGSGGPTVVIYDGPFDLSGPHTTDL